MRSLYLPVFVSFATLLAHASPATACGGCFAPPAETSQVTGHRMVFSVSEARTVLWDQFQYDGDPEDFAWVLPVSPGAELEIARDEWFDALEALTATRVTAPQVPCAVSGSGGCALGSASDEAGKSAFAEYDGVRVLEQGTVGPYERVTLRSTSGESLHTWLSENGYAVASEITPVIDAYVDEGADFVALKLSPGRDIQQMTPVRVVTEGGPPILPLRMVAAGAAREVDIVLYVIGEGRYAMPDLAPMTIDESRITWDFDTNESDYAELRQQALEQHGGRTHLTTFAQPQPFARQFVDPSGSTVNFVVDEDTFDSRTTFAELYFELVARESTTPASDCSDVATYLERDDVVVDEAGSGLSSRVFACGEATDLATALVGLRPSETWLTRLEMRLPRAALDADCAVEPAPDPEPVSNLMLAGRFVNRPCPEPIFTSRMASSKPTHVGPWLFGFVLAGLASRRLRTRRSLGS